MTDFTLAFDEEGDQWIACHEPSTAYGVASSPFLALADLAVAMSDLALGLEQNKLSKHLEAVKQALATRPATLFCDLVERDFLKMRSQI